MGPAVLSFRPVEKGGTSVVALYRSGGREPFDKSEADLIHLTLSEIPWLHQEGWAGDAVATTPKLSRQQRLTLNLALEGLNRSQIAERMSLSTETVGGYLKQVYRHFNVASQTQLMARFTAASIR